MSACELPSLELDAALAADRPQAFAAPWEAQAFALALALHERGLFTWPEWADALGAEIGRARRLGDPDDGRGYYGHWLAALEKIVAAKGVTSPGMLALLKERWDAAARETPHGEPVMLGR
ncbi:MAG: nitrile hydratase accessory protein [Beijerinckiaceae bacterium]